MNRQLTAALFVCSIGLCGCPHEGGKACTPPKDYWQRPHNFLGLVPTMNEVALDHAGALYWNGRAVSRAKLGEYLNASHRLIPEPVVFLEAEMGVSCGDLDAVRKQIDDAVDCRDSHKCAEGIMSVWKSLPSTDSVVS